MVSENAISDAEIAKGLETIRQLSLTGGYEGVALKKPIANFSIKEFKERHGGGATIEMRNEQLAIKTFNESRTSFLAWVLMPLTASEAVRGIQEEWLVFVSSPPPEIQLPKVGEQCSVSVANTAVIAGKRIATGFMPASRVENPFEGTPYTELARKLAFKVFPRMGKGPNRKAADTLEKFATVEKLSDLHCRRKLTLDNSIEVIIRIECNLISYLAEMSALHFLTDPKRDADRDANSRSLEAFHWILDFKKEPQTYINLFDSFPHMKSPAATDIPEKLVEIFEKLNTDHRAAYEGLMRVPARLHMVSGCPGAGKTHWNLVVSAIAQAKLLDRELPTGRFCKARAKVLYLVDVNKPVDDIADRMFHLCRDVGLDVKVIRMHGWPYEIRQSQHINGASMEEVATTLNELLEAKPLGADFTTQFLSMAQVHDRGNKPPKRDSNMAPNLDQAAWEHFHKHKVERYKGLATVLDKLLDGAIQNNREMISLRRCVYGLYADVLKEADFVATTPVSSYGNFPKMFRPDIIFLDEAPHARELTSLIPIAFFAPMVWVLSGDFRQTRPFVASSGGSDEPLNNPFWKQLTISSMERASHVGALSNNLLINHRAYGNLERLASEMFYGGKMRSGIPEKGRFPPTVQHLRSYLERLKGGPLGPEPRLIVHILRSHDNKKARSFYNKVHQDWIMERVRELLADDNFRRVDKPNEPGTVMIITPYRAAVGNYHLLVKDLGASSRKRVEVRTVDTAQGHQADVVLLDLVRTRSPGFMDDPHRLNVAITRARQAEIIVMHPYMTRKSWGGRLVDTKHLLKMWNDCKENNQFTTVY